MYATCVSTMPPLGPKSQAVESRNSKFDQPVPAIVGYDILMYRTTHLHCAIARKAKQFSIVFLSGRIVFLSGPFLCHQLSESTAHSLASSMYALCMYATCHLSTGVPRIGFQSKILCACSCYHFSCKLLKVKVKYQKKTFSSTRAV